MSREMAFNGEKNTHLQASLRAQSHCHFPDSPYHSDGVLATEEPTCYVNGIRLAVEFR